MSSSSSSSLISFNRDSCLRWHPAGLANGECGLRECVWNITTTRVPLSWLGSARLPLHVHTAKGIFFFFSLISQVCKSQPVSAAHLYFDDASPRPTASVPLALPYPSDRRPASALSPCRGGGIHLMSHRWKSKEPCGRHSYRRVWTDSARLYPSRSPAGLTGEPGAERLSRATRSFFQPLETPDFSASLKHVVSLGAPLTAARRPVGAARAWWLPYTADRW